MGKRDQEEEEAKQIFDIKQSPMKGNLGSTPQKILDSLTSEQSGLGARKLE